MDASSLLERLLSGFFTMVTTLMITLGYDMAYGHNRGLFTDNMRIGSLFAAVVVGYLINKPIYLFFVACVSVLLFFLSAVIY